jgi:hypothetical protein
MAAKKNPVKVSARDFTDKELGKAIPFGGCDVKKNEGWASVGIDHDTAQFACEAVWRWRQFCRGKNLGSKRYERAKRILVTADGGGSNASRSRL